MENLNAEQVKKALECCSDDNSCYTKGCPYKSDEVSACTTKMSKDALALINSLEQRIKELAEEVEMLTKAKYIFSTVDYCADDLAKALEENKRLTVENERLRKSRSILAPIRGFTPDEIDQIAKEMSEGENEN